MRILVGSNKRLLVDGMRPYIRRVAAAVTLLEAGTLDEALTLAEGVGEIDMAVLSLGMPGMNGLAGMISFAKIQPRAKPVLCLFSGTVDLAQALAAGAQGVITTSVSGEGLTCALRLVAAGVVYLPSELMAFQQQEVAVEQTTAHASGDLSLSPSEREVAPLLASGLSNKVIAVQLGIEEAAVKARLRGLYRKVGACNRAQAAVALRRWG